MRSLIIYFSLLLTMTVYSESWTNAAGHSVEAELVARKGNVLTMKRADGSLFKINLNGLSKKCRITVKEKFPEPKKSHGEIVLERNEKRLEQLHNNQDRKKQQDPME